MCICVSCKYKYKCEILITELLLNDMNTELFILLLRNFFREANDNFEKNRFVQKYAQHLLRPNIFKHTLCMRDINNVCLLEYHKNMILINREFLRKKIILI